MADRTSAEIFGSIFMLLSKRKTCRPSNRALEGANRKFTLKLWAMTQNYDFSPDQMGVDSELVKLGLAKLGLDPNYPDDGPVMIYADTDGSFS